MATQRLEEQERRLTDERERRITQQREVRRKEKQTAEKIAARAYAQNYLMGAFFAFLILVYQLSFRHDSSGLRQAARFGLLLRPYQARHRNELHGRPYQESPGQGNRSYINFFMLTKISSATNRNLRDSSPTNSFAMSSSQGWRSTSNLVIIIFLYLQRIYFNKEHSYLLKTGQREVFCRVYFAGP